MNKDEILIAVITSLLGVPYKWGGDDPMAGFDCSGGVQEILATIGQDPHGDQTAATLMDHFSKPENGLVPDSVKLGDLLFFGQKGIPSHIGIAVSDFAMFEFGGGGSKTNSLEDAVSQNAYGRIRPIRTRTGFIKALRPRR